jgi:hypothetical protein
LKHVKSYKNIFIVLENVRKWNYIITIFLQIEMNVNEMTASLLSTWYLFYGFLPYPSSPLPPGYNSDSKW